MTSSGEVWGCTQRNILSLFFQHVEEPQKTRNKHNFRIIVILCQIRLSPSYWICNKVVFLPLSLFLIVSLCANSCSSYSFGFFFYFIFWVFLSFNWTLIWGIIIHLLGSVCFSWNLQSFSVILCGPVCSLTYLQWVIQLTFCWSSVSRTFLLFCLLLFCHKFIVSNQTKAFIRNIIALQCTLQQTVTWL